MLVTGFAHNFESWKKFGNPEKMSGKSGKNLENKGNVGKKSGNTKNFWKVWKKSGK